MRQAEGWGGFSLKQHIEDAQNTAADALDVAQTACTELEVLRDEIAELRRAVGLPVAVDYDL